MEKKPKVRRGKDALPTKRHSSKKERVDKYKGKVYACWVDQVFDELKDEEENKNADI